MNTLKTYADTITVFKVWDEVTREGVINIAHKETGANFDLGIKYVKEDKILAFYDQEHPTTRLEPWRLIRSLITTGEAPELVPHTSPVAEKIKEQFEEPCPEIYITRLEWDVLINGFLLNPENDNKEPWKNGTIEIPSNTVSDATKTAEKKQVPTVMASLTKKGLIKCEGTWPHRRCHTTHNGNLVIRRETVGA